MVFFQRRHLWTFCYSGCATEYLLPKRQVVRFISSMTTLTTVHRQAGRFSVMNFRRMNNEHRTLFNHFRINPR